jgi:hypothetical protein
MQIGALDIEYMLINYTSMNMVLIFIFLKRH